MKIGRLITNLAFYLSSFIPLYLLLIMQNLSVRDGQGAFLDKKEFVKQFYNSGPERLFWVSILILIFISFLSIFFFKRWFLDNEGVPGRIIGETFENGDTLGYIVTYIVPLLSMEIDSYRSLSLNFALFAITGLFYIKNNLLFMNPIFDMMGYQVLLSDGYVYITKLSKRRMKEFAKEQEQIIKVPVSEDIFIIKEIKAKLGS